MVSTTTSVHQPTTWITSQERHYTPERIKEMERDTTGMEIDYLDADASPRSMETQLRGLAWKGRTDHENTRKSHSPGT